MEADRILKPTHRNFKDIEGQTFGRLTVVAYAGTDERGKALWTCRCICGTVKDLAGTLLITGHTLSCGCLLEEARLVAGQANRTHGHSLGHKPSPEYQTWTNMKRRCYDPKDKGYKWYGAQGVTVCQSWLDSFEAFLRAVGPRPGPGYSIERVKNTVGYQDGNVIWATATEQANNRRSNRLITYEGKTITAARLAREHGIPPKVFVSRLHHGWEIEEALATPVGETRPRSA